MYNLSIINKLYIVNTLLYLFVIRRENFSMEERGEKRTTISISPQTKKQLIKIKGKMEAKSGSGCNMDMVVNHLIEVGEEK